MTENLSAAAQRANLTPEQRKQIDGLGKLLSTHKNLLAMPAPMAQQKFSALPQEQQNAMVGLLGGDDAPIEENRGWLGNAKHYAGIAVRETLGRGVAAFRYKNNSKFYSYTYYKLRSLMEPIKQFEDNGSVFGSIGKDDFKKLENIIPPFKLIEDYQKEAKPIDNKILLNEHQIRTLTQTRDTLLPKLMSGEVRVNLN